MKAKTILFSLSIVVGMGLFSCEKESMEIVEVDQVKQSQSNGNSLFRDPEMAPEILVNDIIIGDCVSVDPGNGEPGNSEPTDPNPDNPNGESPVILYGCAADVTVDLDPVTYNFFVAGLGQPLIYKFYRYSDQDAVADHTFSSMGSAPTFQLNDGEQYAMLVCSGSPCYVTYSNNQFFPPGSPAITSPIYDVTVPDCCPWDDPTGPGDDNPGTD